MTRRLSTILTLPAKLVVIALIAYFSIFSVYVVYKKLTGDTSFEPIKLIAFIGFGALISIFARFMCGSLKRVYKDGNSLLVSNYLREIRIPITDIEQVTGPDGSSLQRIEVSLLQPSAFGDKIIFAPKVMEASSIAEELYDIANT